MKERLTLVLSWWAILNAMPVAANLQQMPVGEMLSEIQVTEAYIGLLDRAPDPDGLAYWVSQLNRAVAAGQDATLAMKKLTNDIALSPEWTAGLGANDATTQAGSDNVVEGMYQHLFERAATQADLDWWTPQLTGGSTTAAEMALNLITAAKSNTEKPADGNVLGFKQEAATYYVDNVPQANYALASARSAAKDVNDAGSLIESKTLTDLIEAGLDYGSGGGGATGSSSSITLQPGETLVLPFSVVPGNHSGNIGIVPTSTPFPEDGSEVRMWFSSKADGTPLSNRWCSGNLGQEGALNWEQTGVNSWKCSIPNENVQFFVNLKLCKSIRLDRSCNDPGVEYGTEAAVVYIAAQQFN